MIRALYTAASGMNAQQANIDNVAHNLANVNTTGFKKSRMEFEDLVYQQTKAPPARRPRRRREAPIGLETGLGTRAVATARDFSTGNLQVDQRPARHRHRGQRLLPDRAARRRRPATPAPATFHLDADGKLADRRRLCRCSRRSPFRRTRPSVSISKDGIVSVAVRRPGGAAADRHDRAGHVPERRRLHALGGNLFAATTGSGDPTTGVPGTDGIGTIAQGFLEESNVSVVEEMVNMILGQRAYEANSRVIKAADEMLGQVNNLGR